jgi:nicotinamide-nucleotide amidase
MTTETDADLLALAQEAGAALSAAGLMLATAESCTGGWIAQSVTDIAGSSGWFDRGFVAYTNESKADLLGVSPAIIAAHGAVSEAAVLAMVTGALAHSRAQVAVAVTGIAGPGGGSPEKPVGTVWLAWQRQGRDAIARLARFDGDRRAVRRQTVLAALRGVIDACRD